MYRRTKNAKIALERMQRSPRAGQWDPGPGRTTIRRVAFMADMARRKNQYELPAEIRWTGSVPTRGVKGWEAEALGWLRLR